MTAHFDVVTAPDYSGVDWANDVVLVSNDNVSYKITKSAAKELSNYLKDVVDNLPEGEKSIVPVAEADTETLKYVVMYINHHHNNRTTYDKRPLNGPIKCLFCQWDQDFIYTDLIKNEDETQHEMLVKVLNAANFLQIEDLLTLGGGAMASMIRGKTTEQLRELFHLENDFSPEEWAELNGDFSHLENKEGGGGASNTGAAAAPPPSS